MIRACQAVREDIERINHDTEVKKTVAHVKTNIDPETKPSSRASLLTQLSLSPTLALFSFILSFSPYWAAKLSLSFTAYPGREGNNVSTLCSPEYLLETQSGLLFPIFFFFLFSLSFFFHTPFLQREGGGNLNRLAVKANSSLFSLFSFPAVRSFFLLGLCKHKHILSINRKGQRRWEWKRLILTKDIIIDCKLRNISQLNRLRILWFSSFHLSPKTVEKIWFTTIKKGFLSFVQNHFLVHFPHCKHSEIVVND